MERLPSTERAGIEMARAGTDKKDGVPLVKTAGAGVERHTWRCNYHSYQLPMTMRSSPIGYYQAVVLAPW